MPPVRAGKGQPERQHRAGAEGVRRRSIGPLRRQTRRPLDRPYRWVAVSERHRSSLGAEKGKAGAPIGLSPAAPTLKGLPMATDRVASKPVTIVTRHQTTPILVRVVVRRLLTVVTVVTAPACAEAVPSMGGHNVEAGMDTGDCNSGSLGGLAGWCRSARSIGVKIGWRDHKACREGA